jgi:hypothetical protein
MPYAFREADGATWVYVYDSNNPASATQYISITPSANSWIYNHNNPIGVWQSGQTCKQGLLVKHSAQLSVVPLSAWKKHPTPPWSGAGAWRVQSTADSGWYELTVGQNASLQAVDSQGRVVGNRGGELVLEIPGSYLQIPWGVIPGLVVSYPEHYVITSASPLTLSLRYGEAGTAVLDAIVPEGIVTVIGASDVAGVTDMVHISPDARRISVQAGSNGEGRAVTTTRDEDAFGREVSIDNFSLAPGAVAEVQVEASGVVSLTSSLRQTSYGIKLRQAGAVSSAFIADGPAMEVGDLHGIYLDWSDPVTATVKIDHGGDGTVDETRILRNRIGMIYLPLVTRG